ncbi:uncharacterized protein LOC108680757 [Hyalella azteca]|uniref:Uncharacterized protein LOC108680757 n=1 Tax=Hyalella azteca TaxID=294128 RepID=A0A8B7PIH6_HYAAZ|nr:uncharacterized protein LOC108680757 [Hyalella azteca]
MLAAVMIAAAVGNVSASRTVVHGDVCQSFSGRKVYLEPGTTALLYATNNTGDTFKSRTRRNIREYILERDENLHSNRRRVRNIASVDFSNTFVRNAVNDVEFPSFDYINPSSNSDAQILENFFDRNEGNILMQRLHKPVGSVNRGAERNLQGYFETTAANWRTLQVPSLRLSRQMDQEIQRNDIKNSSKEKSAPEIELESGFTGSKDVPKSKPDPLEQNLLAKHLQLKTGLPLATESYSLAHQELHHPPLANVQTPVAGSSVNIHRGFRGSKRDENKLATADQEAVDTQLQQPDLQQCGINVYTCPGCHLHFSFQELHLPSCSDDGSCKCDHLRLSEPPYMNPEDGRDVCGNFEESVDPSTKFVEYTSLTREASLYFFYRNTFAKAFSLRVSALRNSFVIVRELSPSSGVIRSPFFPELYPKDYWVEYIFTGINQTARVQIIFEDFGLSPWSFVEVHDNQRSQVAGFNGHVFRPPLLVSQGTRLVLKFAANGDTGRGFKFRYVFADVKDLLPPYRSDCGGFVTNIGGTITMLNMTVGRTSGRVTTEAPYDCVWLIKPPQEYGLKSHLSIRVHNFDYMGYNSTIEIRKGLTSDDLLLEELTQNGSGRRVLQGKEHVVAVGTGFYVRLRGSFMENSHFALVYASFNYMGGCYPLMDLKCLNQRCVPKMLRCDGFDHCGDGSDEPASCYSTPPGDGNGGVGDETAWWYKHTPNYYFPYRTPIFGDQQGSGILLLTSFFILILVIVCLVSYMIKQGTSAASTRHHRTHRRHRRRDSLNDGVEIFDASADDPPLYEAPPDYEEVVKLILSGNNLKLVRRPGGMTAWVTNVESSSSTEAPITALHRTDLLTPIDTDPNIPPATPPPNFSQLAPLPAMPSSLLTRTPEQRRSRRTRHTSLDLDERADVVLWDPSQGGISSVNGENQDSPYSYRYHPSTPPHLPSALRRSSMQSPTLSVHSQTTHQGQCSIPEINEVGLQDLPKPVEVTETENVTATSSARPAESLGKQDSNQDQNNEGLPSSQAEEIKTGTSKSLIKCTRRSKKCNKIKRKKMKCNNEETSSEDPKPPSYESVLQQVLDEFYITDEAYVIDDMKNNIGAQLRVRVAREKFQQLCASKNDSMDEIYTKTSKQPDPGTNSRKNTISPGTVKRRTAKLLNARRADELKGSSFTNVNAVGVESKQIKQTDYLKNLNAISKSSGIVSKCSFRKNRKASFTRNKSTPSLGNLVSRDLEIYFSQKTPSPVSNCDDSLNSANTRINFENCTMNDQAKDCQKEDEELYANSKYLSQLSDGFRAGSNVGREDRHSNTSDGIENNEADSVEYVPSRNEGFSVDLDEAGKLSESLPEQPRTETHDSLSSRTLCDSSSHIYEEFDTNVPSETAKETGAIPKRHRFTKVNTVEAPSTTESCVEVMDSE